MSFVFAYRYLDLTELLQQTEKIFSESFFLKKVEIPCNISQKIEYKSLPSDDESIARRIYDYAVKKKLERIKEFGIDLTGLYSRFAKNRTN